MLTLDQALSKLSQHAFSRTKPAEKLVRRYFDLPEPARKSPSATRVFEWLLVPFSLWPIDFIGAGNCVFGAFESGKRPKPILAELLSLLDELPTPEECAAVANYEQDVAKGDYSNAVRADFKYEECLAKLQTSQEFKDQWNWLKSNFPREIPAGVLRRRMIAERGFRSPDWNWTRNSRKELFRHAFDAFCHRWCLYGMEGDKPLLQKFTTSITPHGTMVFIPRYWSFAPHRDIKWAAITKLHRSRNVHRQGQKLLANFHQRQKISAEAVQADAEARGLGLKGEKYREWMVGKLSLSPRTDSRQIRRLVNGK